MAIKPKTTLCSLFVLSFFLSNLHNNPVHGAPQVPCYFIFGDSLSDFGNNNNLLTVAKANYRPYGIDFFSSIPTGRFSNGRNKIDVIAKRLGYDSLISPFATASGPEILKGVNYASAASGIRDETGKQAGQRISFDRQILNHNMTVASITQLLGNETSATAHLNKCLYSVAFGTNDYLLNYFTPLLYTTSSQYTPEQYADVLIQQYSQQIKELYNLGARKTALFGVSPMGCTPYGISLNNKTNISAPCSDNINNAIQIFNDRLKRLVDELNQSLSGAKFIYVNTYEIVSSILSSPEYTVKNASCCLSSALTGVCIPLLPPCRNRGAHVYWDRIHFTEASYSVIGERAYRAQTALDVHPYDISHLVQLK